MLLFLCFWTITSPKPACTELRAQFNITSYLPRLYFIFWMNPAKTTGAWTYRGASLFVKDKTISLTSPLDALMPSSRHFKRGPPASRLTPHPIRGAVVKKECCGKAALFPFKTWLFSILFMFERKHSHMSSDRRGKLQGHAAVATTRAASKYLLVKWQQRRKWSPTLFWFQRTPCRLAVP